MKKTFLAKTALTLIAALFSLTGARAYETGQLTVYNQTGTNSYVPMNFSGFGTSSNPSYARSQFIIPSTATGMSAMTGKTITGITFYANINLNNSVIKLPEGKVYVKEINSANFGNNNTVTFQTGGTTVYEGALIIVKATGELKIQFSTPYTYNGDNLLIGYENTEGSPYSSTFSANNVTFNGQSSNNGNRTAVYGSSSNTTGTGVRFIPKTTFTYLIPDEYPIPTNFKATQVGPYDATISWEGSASSYNLRYREAGTSTTYDFDDSEMGGWTTIDADGDGFKWAINTQDLTYRSYHQAAGLGHNGSTDMVISGSYCSNSNSDFSSCPLTPDNYLVSPSIALGGTISFWAKGMDPHDCAEVFGVAVSTNGNTSAANFTMVGETKTATSEWTLYSFDLSAYAGQNGYVAIRHFNCMDQDLLCVDDIEITAPGGEWTTVNGITDKSKLLKQLTKLTDYQLSVQAVYAGGTSAWTGIRFKTTNENPVPAEIVVDPIAEQTATITWFGLSDNYTVRYRSEKKDGPQYFFEDFEGGFAEKGWTNSKQGEGDGWEDDFDPQGSFKFTAVSGNKTAVAFSWRGTALNADNWLITPAVTIGKMLKFYVRSNPGYPDDYEVLLSTSNNQISSFNVTLQAKTAVPAVNGWTRIEIPIDDEYVDTEGYIAIHHVKYDGNYIVIDDFGLFGPDVTPESAEWETVETGAVDPGYNSVNLTGLIPNTTYDYQIIGYMAGQPNAVTAIATFTTEGMDELELVDNADNTPTIDALHGLVSDVKLVGRTLKANTWNTLCLPCNVKLTSGKLDGVSVDVRKLAGAELDGTTMNLTFENVTELVAGTPYIIKPESAITDPVFANSLVRKGENFPSFTLDGDDIKVSFKGTYKPLTFSTTDKSILFLRNGSFYYPVNGSYINSQRAYLKLSGIHAGKPAPAPTKEFTFKNNLDDDPTAVAELFGLTEDNGAWYDLNGRKLANKPAQKGVYINNGKKTIIK